jgi:hypothetical protein
VTEFLRWSSQFVSWSLAAAAAVSIVSALLSFWYAIKVQEKYQRNLSRVINSWRTAHAISSSQANEPQAPIQDTVFRIQQILDESVSTLGVLTEATVSASLKLLAGQNNEDGGIKVATFARSSDRTIARMRADAELSRIENYPVLVRILKQNESDALIGDIFPTSDDVNQSGSRATFYKSSLVVPIKSRQDRNTQDAIIGFLCFDSPKVEAFNDAALRFSESVADVIATLLERMTAQNETRRGPTVFKRT